MAISSRALNTTVRISLWRSNALPKELTLAEVPRETGMPVSGPPSVRPQKRGMDAIFKDTLAYADVGPRDGSTIGNDGLITLQEPWQVVSSTGSILPEARYEASGYATWMVCQLGAKVCGLVLPKESELDPTSPSSPQKDMETAMRAYYDLRVVKSRTNTSSSVQQLAEVAEPVQTLVSPRTLMYVSALAALYKQ